MDSVLQGYSSNIIYCLIIPQVASFYVNNFAEHSGLPAWSYLDADAVEVILRRVDTCLISKTTSRYEKTVQVTDIFQTNDSRPVLPCCVRYGFGKTAGTTRSARDSNWLRRSHPMVILGSSATCGTITWK